MVKKNEDCDKQETKIKEYFLPNSIPTRWHIPIYFLIILLCGSILLLILNYFELLNSFIRLLPKRKYK
jgi:hypothetical protein